MNYRNYANIHTKEEKKQSKHLYTLCQVRFIAPQHSPGFFFGGKQTNTARPVQIKPFLTHLWFERGAGGGGRWVHQHDPCKKIWYLLTPIFVFSVSVAVVAVAGVVDVQSTSSSSSSSSSRPAATAAPSSSSTWSSAAWHPSTGACARERSARRITRSRFSFLTRIFLHLTRWQKERNAAQK